MIALRACQAFSTESGSERILIEPRSGWRLSRRPSFPAPFGANPDFSQIYGKRPPSMG